MTDQAETYTAFLAGKRIAGGSMAEVGAAVRAAMDSDADAMALIFEDATGRTIDVDLRGTPEEVRARLAPAEAPRGPGRPKLGVTAREVTLLPRHWDWLAAQPGGASVTLRKLVEQARHAGGGKQRRRAAQDAAYRFMSAIVGDAAGFEEAIRALYASDRAGFDGLVETWPADVRDHARRLAADAFVADA